MLDSDMAKENVTAMEKMPHLSSVSEVLRLLLVVGIVNCQVSPKTLPRLISSMLTLGNPRIADRLNLAWILC